MKRGGPLKRTELKRGSSQLRRTRLSPVSDKRREESPERHLIVDLALSRDRGCRARLLVPEVACAGRLDPDERIARSAWPGGELVLDNVQILCRAHHDWKHAHPEKAHALGLHGWSWERPK